MFALLCGAAPAACIVLLAVYIYLNDKKLLSQPHEARSVTPTRVTVSSVRKLAARIADIPHPVLEQLPPVTGRRYIVVGGAGFLGGWMVVHLLARGEDPQCIRVLDIRPPTRKDLTTGKAKKVDFRKVDVTDAKAVSTAFEAPWPDSITDARGGLPPLTVFHAASIIRFWERVRSLLPISTKVNVTGTQHILDAARAVGASVLVYTSSGSVGVRRTRFLLWPWESRPRFFVQALSDDDEITPKSFEGFWSNYSYTKCHAERLVRQADGTTSGSGCLKTGAIRPGNGIYGGCGDMLAEAAMLRKKNPSWIQNTIHNFCAVENVSLAHLCYERRLIDLQPGSGTTNPDIGGQSFVVVDPGPPPTYGDVYLTLHTLTDGRTVFPYISPTLMLFVAHGIESLYLARRLLQGSSVFALRFLARFLPPITGDVINLQPSLYSLTMVHLVFDDSRARLPPAKGGLGYQGGFTTMEGMARLAVDFKRSGGAVSERSMSGGISLEFGLTKAMRRLWSKAKSDVVAKVIEIDTAGTAARAN